MNYSKTVTAASDSRFAKEERSRAKKEAQELLEKADYFVLLAVKKTGEAQVAAAEKTYVDSSVVLPMLEQLQKIQHGNRYGRGGSGGEAAQEKMKRMKL